MDLNSHDDNLVLGNTSLLNEADYMPMDLTKYFAEYVEKSTGKKLSAFETSVVTNNPSEKTPFEYKIEAYQDVQNRVSGLVKVLGYFIKKKSKNVTDWTIEYVVLIEDKVQSLADQLQSQELDKKDLLSLASSISSALNGLCETQFKVSYIAVDDIAVIQANGSKEFKFFGIQNNGGISSVPAAMSYWVCPQMFSNMKLNTRNPLDLSKSLNYSFGLLLLRASRKQGIPTAYRSTLKNVPGSTNTLQEKEKEIIQSITKNLRTRYISAPGNSDDEGKTKRFLEYLESSLAYDIQNRAGLEIWLSMDDPVAQTEIAQHEAALLIKEEPPQSLHQPRTFYQPIRQKVEGLNQYELELYNRPKKRSLWEPIRDLDCEEMRGCSLIVGGFLGLIFMGGIIVILLVAG